MIALNTHTCEPSFHKRRLTSLLRGYELPAFDPSKANKKTVLEAVKQADVKFIDMQFTDLHGIVKAVTLPVGRLESAIDQNVWFDGSSIEGFTRIFESDMYLKLDLSTFAIYPWTIGSDATTARIICDVYRPDGTPFEGDPRHILKRQLEKVKKLGYAYNTGPELEFFLFKFNNGKPSPLPNDNAGYFDLTTDRAQEIRQDMSFALESMGVEVESLHHECGIGQHEIGFKYGDALTTADRAVTFKTVLKAVANMYDLHATFMPKPITGIAGSGMHVHQSLSNVKTGKTAFYDKNDSYKLSKLAKQFIAGQLHHIRAMNAVINPTVNSYKRLVPGYEAPVYVAWANTNRSALIRVPRYTVGREEATRCELRCPDPSSNPYLAFSVMLAAGLDGIKHKMTPPTPLEENIYHLSNEALTKHKVGNVSENLFIALQELKKDEVIKEALGDYTFQRYFEVKMDEWKDYSMHVSQWELDRYLEIF